MNDNRDYNNSYKKIVIAATLEILMLSRAAEHILELYARSFLTTVQACLFICYI